MFSFLSYRSLKAKGTGRIHSKCEDIPLPLSLSLPLALASKGTPSSFSPSFFFPFPLFFYVSLRTFSSSAPPSHPIGNQKNPNIPISESNRNSVSPSSSSSFSSSTVSSPPPIPSPSLSDAQSHSPQILLENITTFLNHFSPFNSDSNSSCNNNIPNLIPSFDIHSSLRTFHSVILSTERNKIKNQNKTEIQIPISDSLLIQITKKYIKYLCSQTYTPSSFSLAFSSFYFLIHYGILPPLSLFHSLLNCLVQWASHGNHGEATNTMMMNHISSILSVMKQSNISPTLITYSIILRGKYKIGDDAGVLSLYHDPSSLLFTERDGEVRRIYILSLFRKKLFPQILECQREMKIQIGKKISQITREKQKVSESDMELAISKLQFSSYYPFVLILFSLRHSHSSSSFAFSAGELFREKHIYLNQKAKESLETLSYQYDYSEQMEKNNQIHQSKRKYSDSHHADLHFLDPHAEGSLSPSHFAPLSPLSSSPPLRPLPSSLFIISEMLTLWALVGEVEKMDKFLFGEEKQKIEGKTPQGEGQVEGKDKVEKKNPIESSSPSFLPLLLPSPPRRKSLFREDHYCAFLKAQYDKMIQMAKEKEKEKDKLSPSRSHPPPHPLLRHFPLSFVLSFFHSHLSKVENSYQKYQKIPPFSLYFHIILAIPFVPIRQMVMKRMELVHKESYWSSALYHTARLSIFTSYSQYAKQQIIWNSIPNHIALPPYAYAFYVQTLGRQRGDEDLIMELVREVEGKRNSMDPSEILSSSFYYHTIKSLIKLRRISDSIQIIHRMKDIYSADSEGKKRSPMPNQGNSPLPPSSLHVFQGELLLQLVGYLSNKIDFPSIPPSTFPSSPIPQSASKCLYISAFVSLFPMLITFFHQILHTEKEGYNVIAAHSNRFYKEYSHTFRAQRVTPILPSFSSSSPHAIRSVWFHFLFKYLFYSLGIKDFEKKNTFYLYIKWNEIMKLSGVMGMGNESTWCVHHDPSSLRIMIPVLLTHFARNPPLPDPSALSVSVMDSDSSFLFSHQREESFSFSAFSDNFNFSSPPLLSSPIAFSFISSLLSPLLSLPNDHLFYLPPSTTSYILHFLSKNFPYFTFSESDSETQNLFGNVWEFVWDNFTEKYKKEKSILIDKGNTKEEIQRELVSSIHMLALMVRQNDDNDNSSLPFISIQIPKNVLEFLHISPILSPENISQMVREMIQNEIPKESLEISVEVTVPLPLPLTDSNPSVRNQNISVFTLRLFCSQRELVQTEKKFKWFENIQKQKLKGNPKHHIPIPSHSPSLSHSIMSEMNKRTEIENGKGKGKGKGQGIPPIHHESDGESSFSSSSLLVPLIPSVPLDTITHYITLHRNKNLSLSRSRKGNSEDSPSPSPSGSHLTLYQLRTMNNGNGNVMDADADQDTDIDSDADHGNHDDEDGQDHDKDPHPHPHLIDWSKMNKLL